MKNKKDKLKQEIDKDNSRKIENTKISKLSFSNFRFFKEKIEFDFENKDVLIYGENGSGKSSIYRFFELLCEPDSIQKNLLENKNIFANNEEEVAVEVSFSNGETLFLDEGHPEISDDIKPILSDLEIYKPTLDYKDLLKIHYSTNKSNEINIYNIFKELLAKYPVDKDKKLFELFPEDPDQYFIEMERIVEKEILGLIQENLKKFTKDILLEKFVFRKAPAEDGRIEFVVNLEVFYLEENRITQFHHFLNEAILSSLAISIYLAIIKKMSFYTNEEQIKILVIDDLLVSLDMSNRKKLINIFKEDFQDFQIFFFTHDKSLFELYKDKLEWKKFELYYDDTDTIPKSMIKSTNRDFDKAKVFFVKKEYECCALYLRKSLENILKKSIHLKHQKDKNCAELDLSKMINKGKSILPDDFKRILTEIDSDRKHILNPLCHLDSQQVFAEELKDAMQNIEKLYNAFGSTTIIIRNDVKTKETKSKAIFNFEDDILEELHKISETVTLNEFLQSVILSNVKTLKIIELDKILAELQILQKRKLFNIETEAILIRIFNEKELNLEEKKIWCNFVKFLYEQECVKDEFFVKRLEEKKCLEKSFWNEEYQIRCDFLDDEIRNTDIEETPYDDVPF